MRSFVARFHASRVLYFGAVLLGLGLGASLTLDSLWHGIRRENLPGVDPVRAVFNVELKGANNREILNREDAVRLVNAAVPGAEVITVRRIDADAEYRGRSVGAVRIAVVPDNALALLGIAVGRGRVPEHDGNGPSRQLVISQAFAGRLLQFAPSEFGEIKLKSRSVVRHDAVGFQVVGVAAAAVRGLTYGQDIDLWVGEREWPNWLLAAEIPERILDVLHPVQTVLVLPQESMSARSLAARLIRASETSGHPATANVVEGSARDPSTTPRAQAQTLIYSTLAISTLAICAIGAMFLWALALARGRREIEIRTMLGEPLNQSRVRLFARSVVSILIGLVLAVVLSLCVLRLLAAIDPYRNFALGSWFLPAGEFAEALMRSAWVPLCLLLLQFISAELALRRINRDRLSGVIGANAPLSALIALSAGVSVIACTVAAIAFLGQHRLETRNLGFVSDQLIQVAVVRSDEQLIDAARDARPANPIIGVIRERLLGVSGAIDVSASSVHPLRKMLTIEYTMNDEQSDRRSLGNVVKIDGRFFSVLGLSSPYSSRDQVLALPGDRVLIDHAFEQAHARSGTGIRTFRLFDMDAANHPVVSVEGVVPSIFHDGATGSAVPSIFRTLTRRGDIQWIWIRTDGSVRIDDIEKIVAQSLAEFGVPFERIEAQAFSEAMRDQLLPRLAERNTALIACVILLTLSVVASYALFSFAGRTRAKEFALRMAIGATPMKAMLGLLRSSVWTPLVGVVASWIVAASAALPVLTLLDLGKTELVLAIMAASVATIALLFVGLASIARVVGQTSLRETLAAT